MLGGLIAIVVIGGLLLGPLLWRVRYDRRMERALAIRAQVAAALFRALDGESMVAVQVEPSSRWRAGRVVLSAPADWQWLLELAWSAIAAHVPADYEVVVKPVAAARRAPVKEEFALRRAA